MDVYRYRLPAPSLEGSIAFPAMYRRVLTALLVLLITAPACWVLSSNALASAERESVNPYVVPGVFRGLLEPTGIGRRHWRSFDYIPPRTGPAPTPARYVVMLDPGHGGIDPGARGPGGLLEKHLTLDIARRVALFLSEIKEIDVQLTRNDDTGLARHERVGRVRRSEADLVISLHLNHLPQTEVTLVESYYAGPQHLSAGTAHLIHAHMAAAGPDAESFTDSSARIARIVQSSVYSEVSFANPDAVNAGVKRRRLYMLSESHTPGVLVEMTCLSNPAEEANLATEDYRNRLAASIADAIRAYFMAADPMLLADRVI